MPLKVLSKSPASVFFSITATIVSPGISAMRFLSCSFRLFSSSNSNMIRRLSLSCASAILALSFSKCDLSCSFSLRCFSVSSSILFFICIRSCKSASTFFPSFAFSSASLLKRPSTSAFSRRFFSSSSSSLF